MGTATFFNKAAKKMFFKELLIMMVPEKRYFKIISLNYIIYLQILGELGIRVVMESNAKKRMNIVFFHTNVLLWTFYTYNVNRHETLIFLSEGPKLKNCMTSISQKLGNDATLLVESANRTWSNAPYDNLLTVLPILIQHKIIRLAIYLNV